MFRVSHLSRPRGRTAHRVLPRRRLTLRLLRGELRWIRVSQA